MREGDTEGLGGRGEEWGGRRWVKEQWNMGGGVEVNHRNKKREMREQGGGSSRDKGAGQVWGEPQGSNGGG